MKIKLEKIYIYPIKSCGPIQLIESGIDKRGLKYDRRWMIVESNNKFVTQRSYPKMALIKVDIQNNNLIVNAPDMDTLKIDINKYTEKTLEVNIWKDNCQANIVSSEASGWFSNYLSTKCNLVFMPDTTKRLVDDSYQINQELVSFADGFPFLLTNTASLNDLNSKIKSKTKMLNFRPNLVISGDIAFQEDNWKNISIGNNKFIVSKPCSRCKVINIDQKNSNINYEVLKVLANYRNFNGEVIFGQNLIHKKNGYIKVGDDLSIN